MDEKAAMFLLVCLALAGGVYSMGLLLVHLLSTLVSAQESQNNIW